MEKLSFPEIGEELYSSSLPNGLRINVVPKPGFSSSYAVLAVNYGGAHRRFLSGGDWVESPGGVAHFLEHKMFDLPGGDNALNVLTANGAEPNAFTSSSETCYHFSCTRAFEEDLRMLLHFVSTPYFTQETVDKERGIIAQEILMGEDSPDAKLYYGLLGQLYRHHPVKDRVAGTVESIGRISPETLYACHRAFYVPSNMALCVEGDVDPVRVEEIAREVLPQEASPLPQADFGPGEDMLPVESLRRESMEVAAPLFLIGSKFAPQAGGRAALRERLTARLAMRMLCGPSSGFYTRLYGQGLLDRSFDYDVDYCAGAGTIMLGGESKDPEKVLEELTKELDRISRQGFEKELFTQCKRSSLGSRLRGLEDFENVCISLAMGLFDGYCALDSVKELETVTMEDCRRFLIQALSPERLALSVICAKEV